MIGAARSLNSNVPTMARAIVRENNDPDKLGRVRVEYPWFHGDSAQKPSQWARLCLPYASKESGMWMLPEVGSECLVFFENGSLDCPILLGNMYNGKNGPPVAGRDGDHNSNNKNDLKYIKTRSGHMICFDDSDGKSGIVIKDKENRRFEIQSKEKKVIVSDDKDNSLTIEESSVTLKDKGGNKVVIDDSGVALTHKGGDKITIAAGGITIDSSKQIKLTEAASQSLVLGESFMAYFNTHTHVSPVGPCSPPVVPMLPTMLSMKVKTS